MDYKKTINGLRQRSAAVGLPWRDLCSQSGTHVSTLYRWQQPSANPRLRDLEAALQRMAEHLDRRETAMLAYLQDRQKQASLKQERIS